MSANEFSRWREFYLRQPFDDVHLYYRPAALIAQSMSGADFSESVHFLIDSYEAKPEGDEEDIPDGMDVLERMKISFPE